MKFFVHSNGMILTFGFDMRTRQMDDRMICWNDPTTQEWDSKASNLAGFQMWPFPLAIEHIHEGKNGEIIAYQPGRTIVMNFVGFPYIWRFSVMKPDNAEA